MPALDWITIKGFKSLKSVEKLRLHDVNVIIGANGSGKSNFISAFSFLHAIREGRLEETVKRGGGADEFLYYGRSETDELEFRISFQDETNQYEIRLLGDDRNRLVPFSESASFWDKSRYDQPFGLPVVSKEAEAGISEPQARPVAHYVRQHLEKWRLYHFHDTSSDAPLKKTAELNDNRFLRPDGSNIAAVLYLLKEKFPDHYKRIISTIRDVAPFFGSFVLEPLELNENKLNLDWIENGHDKFMSAASFSDGTLRFIALATLLLQPSIYKPSVILIDEPELGLHPYALSVLAGLIRYASKTSQIIISTQSAFLLDNFEPDDVLVADRVDGATQFSRLESAKLEGWLEDYSLGQLWEKAEIGGRPRLGKSYD
ncbi:AAA family ATPase [Croceicoccus sp. BE223]|uniref:AAA family ATPase n=1 Tax=Croceicoccus sp. BE223 TaxID=2817716 RepID=UPI002861B7B5|nr:AAA family ATPase [Croceicoccus sp. BE223]MDR7103521.1 putative ATPase [Croceicoccus sp. BE223]